LLSRHDRLSHCSKTVPDHLSATAHPILYSSRHPLTSINGLLNHAEEPSGTPPDLTQKSIQQDKNDTLSTPLIATNGGESRSYDAPTIPQDSYVNQQLSFSLENNTTEYFAIGSMDNFTSFMDSVSIPTHPFSPTYQPVPLLFQVPGLPFVAGSDRDLPSNSLSSNRDSGESVPENSITVMPIARDSDCPLSQVEPQLSSLQPVDYKPADSISQLKDPHLHISADCRQRIMNNLDNCPDCVDEDFTLPSRHVLARFFGGYFSSFHDHFPFLHIPSLRPENITAELFIAIAAVGARYTHELEISIDLFHIAKALVLKRVRTHKVTRPIAAATSIFQKSATFSMRPGKDSDRQDPGSFRGRQQRNIQMIETVLLLVAITTQYVRLPHSRRRRTLFAQRTICKLGKLDPP
jgi:hypothetical protein